MMGPKYKVGDKVRVVHRTEHKYRYRCGFMDPMADLAGQIYTITGSTYEGAASDKLPDDGYIYVLKEAPWSWASSMLEPAEETPSSSKKQPEVLDFTHKKKHYQLKFTV